MIYEIGVFRYSASSTEVSYVASSTSIAYAWPALRPYLAL